jgi:predicted esterase
MSSSGTRSAGLRVQVLEPLKEHRQTVVFCHGLGDSSQGFASMFAGDAMSELLPHCRFVLPNAPTRSVTINGGALMPAWYDIKSLARGLKDEDRDGMLKSVAMLRAIVDDECNRIDSRRVVVGGFSQGGAMAVLLGYTYDRPLSAVFAASAYVVMRDTFPDAMHAANRKTPLMVTHGTDDDVVPLAYAQTTFDDLAERCDVDVRFLTFDGMGHEFPPEIEEEFAVFVQDPNDTAVDDASSSSSSTSSSSSSSGTTNPPTVNSSGAKL